ncbi:hypothetical protein [Dactylococcopsis salina]|uniref:Uncharacterized protein n=1 Tax=Dactylococcopsis salina (strain PCC 8305) TaxID=13035 RepID=K9YU21_DACS8|nr:hypothetical protein [Dactylococcopsis salina]AFZ50002.1 hypothetical protein Dacsa_1307 [Dactylococcopsis salina PCC 8305]
MTTAKVITIHEFSTGIQAQRTEDGNWVSQGFTGKYMNTTLDPIPSIVRKAISNRLFAVAEGKSRNEPALIGREITENNQTWSVIAVVSKGIDDGGRSASMYRYFLSKGKNQLTPILRWLFTVKKDYVFNPFDYQEIGQPHYVDRNKNSPPLDKTDHLIELAAREAPIIIASDDQTIKPLILNSLAAKKAEENGYPIAWAYQVEALEKPRSFQVIYPASAKAEQILRNSLASNPNAPVFIANEQDINTAIKTIFRKGKIELEQLLTLERALQNPQITEEYWQGLFNGQGADQALKSGIYSAQMVRLLALQAAILPATLPKVLGWLEKREKNEEEKKLFIDFQKQVRKILARTNPESEFLALKQQVIEGVRLLIPSVIKQPNLLKPTVSLLKPQNGLWGHFYHYHVKQEIDRDLTTAPQIRGYQPNAVFTLSAEPLWEELFQNIKSTWERNRVSPKEEYLPLAEFFEQVSYYPASALFYHIAWGEVPREVFDACSGRGNHSRKQIYGVWVERHFTLLELILNQIVEIGGSIVPVYMFAPLLILSLLVGGIALPRAFNINLFSPNKSDLKEVKKQLEQLTEENRNLEQREKKLETQLGQIKFQEDLNKAVAKFDSQTRKSIQELLQEIPETSGKSETDKIIFLRKNIFNNDQLQAKAILEDNPQRQWKEEWVRAVYQYQQNNNLPTDGIITFFEDYRKQNGTTIYALYQDIKNSSKVPGG